MTNEQDIVERLREAETYGYMPAKTRAVIRDAIATIEALQAEVAGKEAAAQGVVEVPVEASGRALQKGLAAIAEFVGGNPTVGDARMIYRAMIAAAKEGE